MYGPGTLNAMYVYDFDSYALYIYDFDAYVTPRLAWTFKSGVMVCNNVILSAKRIQLASLTTEGNLLDFETTTYYNISCLINDGYLDSVGGYINLFVLNVNEPPEFNDRVYYCIMNENYVRIRAYKLWIQMGHFVILSPELSQSFIDNLLLKLLDMKQWFVMSQIIDNFASASSWWT